jgi:hypothetical protein
MAKKLQLRGGTTSQHGSFTGALREVTVDTDKDTLVVHDGTTAGGHVLARVDGSMTMENFRSTGIDDNSDALAITIDSSENVGIGNASPTTKLDVTGTTTSTNFAGTFAGDGAGVTGIAANNISSGAFNGLDGSAIWGLGVLHPKTVASNGQTVFTHTYKTIPYVTLQVFLNGVKLVQWADYTEDNNITEMQYFNATDTCIVSAAHGRSVGDKVKVAYTTSYNGWHTVKNVPTVDKFCIEVAFVADDATGKWLGGTPEDFHAITGTNVTLMSGVPTTSNLEFISF